MSTRNKVSATKSFPHGRKSVKMVSTILILILITGLLLAFIVFFFGENPNIKEGSNEWANTYHSSTYPGYGSILVNDQNEICVLTEIGWEVVAPNVSKPSDEPEWIVSGIKDARKGNWNEQSLFAARYVQVKGHLDKQTQTEVLALGIGYFANNKTDCSEEYWFELENALVSRLEGY